MFAVTPGTQSKSFADSVEKSVKDAGASAIKVSNLGKKQLAYPIKRNTEGDYYLVNFEAEGAAIKAIGDKLRLEQEVLLRYLIIKSHKGEVSKVSEVPEVPKVTAKVTVEAKKKDETLGTKKETKSAKSKSKATKVVKKSTKTKAVKGKKK